MSTVETQVRAYLSGPMTGYPEANFPSFVDAATRLRELGHYIVSPAELDVDEGYTPSPNGARPPQYSDFLIRDLAAIQEADLNSIVVIDGWEDSPGARAEVAFGEALGLKILRYRLNPETYEVALEDVSQASPTTFTSSEVRMTDPKTGGQKGSKPERHDLVPIEPRDEEARVYAFGEAKYPGEPGLPNWRRGYAWGLSYAALQRHITAFWRGISCDPESGLHHLAHAKFHLNALMEFDRLGLGTDDRSFKD